MYQADSNNSSSGSRDQTQTPRPLPESAFATMTAPAEATIQERPSHVVINNAGTYKFLYLTTGSIGGTTDETEAFVTGSILDADAGPVTLRINPVAWKSGGAVGKVGDVTFVYRGGL
mgnify:CR=1 FL=1